MDALCKDLAGAGWAVWNLEYRRLGSGGGWPETFLDVDRGIDHLSSRALPELDLSKVVSIGHSAGGQLALWAASRREPRVRITAAVSQAGVVDLAEAHRLRLSRGVVKELLGSTPAEQPERYAGTSPHELVPLGVPQLLVHGARDEIVPVDLSRDYARAASDAGDPVDLVVHEELGHFEHLDPGSPAWASVRDWLGLRHG